MFMFAVQYQQIAVSYRKYISHESVCIGHLYYGIDIGVDEIMSCEKSQKQSPLEHPGIGVWGVIRKGIKVK